MNLLQRLWRKIALLARATLQDLFAEDGTPGSGPGPGEPAYGTGVDRAGLDLFQARLDELQPGLALISARARRMEAEQQHLLSALESLDRAIDEAVSADQDEQARALLGQRNTLQAQADDLALRREEVDGMAREMKADVESLRQHLNQARRQAEELAAREQSAAALEQLAQLRRELNRDLSRLQEDFAHRSARAATIEDRFAALQELERRKR